MDCLRIQPMLPLSSRSALPLHNMIKTFAVQLEAAVYTACIIAIKLLTYLLQNNKRILHRRRGHGCSRRGFELRSQARTLKFFPCNMTWFCQPSLEFSLILMLPPRSGPASSVGAALLAAARTSSRSLSFHDTEPQLAPAAAVRLISKRANNCPQ